MVVNDNTFASFSSPPPVVTTRYYNMIDDLEVDESWRMFRIISEFTEGFDKLSDIGFTISIFGSARTDADNHYYQKTV